MDNIDYANGINCPDDYNDEDMVSDFVVGNDYELLYLDSYLRETFRKQIDA